MSASRTITVDANEAAASVAYRLNEIIAIYPITPSSPMGEFADEWAVNHQPNIWGAVPQVVEMQSEGGAAGAVHGALQGGALTTTFTASQGLLLMIPNLYKIAGELTSVVIHIAARTLATHALSIFGDHSDVYACRQTGFGMLASNNAQEAHDFACIAQRATLESRIPFLHFFDGFRTSHTVEKIIELTNEELTEMIDDGMVERHRRRALSPDRPFIRGTAQNPDVFFQAREAINGYYDACPQLVQDAMDRFAAVTGRQYHLYEYYGHPEAEKVVVLMGSGAETVHETVEWLMARGEAVGVLKVRLYRPFSAKRFIQALPRSTRAVAVLDRTKEPGATGEPLYLDVVAALTESTTLRPRVIGGRYGLASKEFTPAMVKAAFDELNAGNPKNGFSLGIKDDVTHRSLDFKANLHIEPDDVFRALFFGLGADGTVGANKNSIKIIGEETDNFVQAYFVYDSKKAGAVTVSHLRFSRRPIRSAYLISQAHFIGCHQWSFLDRFDILEHALPGAVFLINSPYAPERVWDHLPAHVQTTAIEKKLRLYTIDAYSVAREVGLGRRINSIMQTCFFAISGVLPADESIRHIKRAIEKTYGRKGEEIVRMNFEAIDAALSHLHEIEVPEIITADNGMPVVVPESAPDFVRRVTATMIAGKGDALPVSAFPADGTWPSGTTKWEKRNLALEIPVWDPSICIQCNKCAIICPHAAIRTNVYPADALVNAPDSFIADDYKGREFPDWKYTVQVAPEDCTGCTLCVRICPAHDKSNPRHKALNMAQQMPLKIQEIANFDFFLGLPTPPRDALKKDVKQSQFVEPLFEYSGACSGCGETPYIKLLTQLYGDRLYIANATGCSSIYGGNLPTTPYTQDRDGRGPAWSNSLFEDNAEFGLGIHLAAVYTADRARQLARRMSEHIDASVMDALLDPSEGDEAKIALKRKHLEEVKPVLQRLGGSDAKELLSICDHLVEKTVWVVGGDGWAYDIGYGGLDHVLASGRNVNILVLDTGVYSNTGGQASKATPMAATAKFAMGGKEQFPKDLGLMAMAYGNVYVAQVALGAKDVQTVRAFTEAESYPGPSLIIAYSPCIAHGYDLAHSIDHAEMAVDSGLWPLYRFDPRRAERSLNPLVLDSRPPSVPFERFAETEARFKILMLSDPKRAGHLIERAQARISARFRFYEQMSELGKAAGDGAPGPPPPARPSTRPSTHPPSTSS